MVFFRKLTPTKPTLQYYCHCHNHHHHHYHHYCVYDGDECPCWHQKTTLWSQVSMSTITWVLRIKLSWSGLQVSALGKSTCQDQCIERTEVRTCSLQSLLSILSKSEGIPRTTVTVPSLNAGEQHTHIQHSTQPGKLSPKAFTNTTLCSRILNYDMYWSFPT